MSYFLSETPLSINQRVELSGDEARHILLSRRIEIGEIINVQDPNHRRFEARVVGIKKKSLSIEVIKELKIPKESSLKITIFQALIKEQPLDNIIQKITELGVDALVLFYSKNSVERLRDINKKLVRWRKIGEEAAKQSGRVRPVDIEFLYDKSEIFKRITTLDQTFLLDPNSKQTFFTWGPGPQVDGPLETGPSSKIGLVVGPEGGFTESEVEEFLKLNQPTGQAGRSTSRQKIITPIYMGPRILRADTTAISSAAIVQSLWGDMKEALMGKYKD